MRERVERMLGPAARAIWILTFHSACGRILRREAERLGYRSNFSIYDQADQVRLVKQCLEELERDPKRFVPRGIHTQISNAKNQLISADDYAARVASFYDQTVADVYALYQRRLFASNAVDFDDMLMLTVDVLQRFPEARERWAKTFRYILVDEYQDTNHAQYVLLKLLGGQAPKRHGRRGPGPVGLLVPRRRHPQHPRVREGLPEHEGDPPRAELPLDERDPLGREPAHLAQPRPPGEEPVVGPRRGRAGARRRDRGRARRGAVRRGRDRRAARGRLRPGRDRRRLPHERPEPRARGRARPPGHRLPGDRRPALLRARRDQGRHRLPAGDRQPVRRGQPAADREPPAARHRRHLAEPSRDVRRRPRHLALGGDRAPRRGAVSAPRRSRPSTASATPSSR